jgi:dolichol kinase
MDENDVRAEVPRTFFHVAGGVGLTAAGYLLPAPWNLVALAVAFVAVLGWDLARLHLPIVNAFSLQFLDLILRPWERKGMTGTPAFVGGALLAFVLFTREVALLGMSALILGDRAAVLVGKGFGRTRLVPWKKTLEGSLACFVFSLVAFVLLQRLVPGVPSFGSPTLVWAALVAAVAEAMPAPFNDNLTIPLAVGVFFTIAANVLFGTVWPAG